MTTTIIDPSSIKWMFKDVKNPASPNPIVTWQIGFTDGRKTVVDDATGIPLAKFMEEKAKKEYEGKLITPAGAPFAPNAPQGMDISFSKNGQKV